MSTGENTPSERDVIRRCQSNCVVTTRQLKIDKVRLYLFLKKWETTKQKKQILRRHGDRYVYINHTTAFTTKLTPLQSVCTHVPDSVSWSVVMKLPLPCTTRPASAKSFGMTFHPSRIKSRNDVFPVDDHRRPKWTTSYHIPFVVKRFISHHRKIAVRKDGRIVRFFAPSYLKVFPARRLIFELRIV